MRVALTLLLLACTAVAGDSRFSFERGLMGTRFAITCYGPDEVAARKAADAAFRRAEEINSVASDYMAGSELLRLSEKSGRAVKVSGILFDLLMKSVAMAERTGGLFDPTLGPLTKSWRESRRTGKLPAPESLDLFKSVCGWKLLGLDPVAETILMKKAHMRLDLGGIAKGYAADAMLETMTSAGFPVTSIAAGGDLRLGSPPPGKRGWTVGIKTQDKDKTSGQLELSNCAVSTSGDLHQSVEIEGIRYSHIVDPKTGLGLTSHLAVTIVAADATTSDALATAACLAKAEQVEAMARSWGASDVRISRDP